MKLRVNKNGKGYATGYTLSVGCKEAREAGFLAEDGSPLELEKVVNKGSIVIQLARDSSEHTMHKNAE